MIDPMYQQFFNSSYNQSKFKSNSEKYSEIKRAGSYGKLQSHPKGLHPCKSPENLIIQLPILMKVLGVYLGTDTNTFLKLLRVCHYFLIELSRKTEN